MSVPSGGGDGEDETSEETMMMATGVGGGGAHGIDRQTAEHRGTQGRGARTARVSGFY